MEYMVGQKFRFDEFDDFSEVKILAIFEDEGVPYVTYKRVESDGYTEFSTQKLAMFSRLYTAERLVK